MSNSNEFAKNILLEIDELETDELKTNELETDQLETDLFEVDEFETALPNSCMLKTTISDTWQRDGLPNLMMLAMDVVESLFGLEARDRGEVELFELERELADELDSQLGSLSATDTRPISGQALLAALYGPLGFVGDWERFFAVDNCLMDRVLSRRRGIPVSMAVLVLYLCERFGIRAEGISFPGHFLVRIFNEPTANSDSESESTDSCDIIDPFTGKVLSHHQIEQLLRGARGNLAKLTPQHLVPAEPLEVIMRLLNVTKASFIHHQHFTHALMCSQLLLTLKPECPLERRDRGFLYEQLECHQLAVDDFEYFIEQCPEDPLAEVLKIQALALDLLPSVLH
ncbi:SirB1 family protein [Oceanisphaera sp. W20_SRM_FM3]|uniref:SirB1 family protein n=1 Tax=Oceanisphaera sp. W20_SRM_FM3 TaxID=3240267 RepID=UPI003F9AAA9D